MVLLVGGTVGLAEFCKIRYQFRNTTVLSEEEREQLGMKPPKKQKSLEEEYQEYKDKDLDSWSNIRGPRPWEDSKEMQDEQRKQMGLPTSQS